MRILIAILCFAAPAQAQLCARTADQLQAALARNFKEAPTGWGDASNGKWTFTASDDGGFTIIFTDTDTGVSCIVGAGKNLKLKAFVKGEKT